MRNFFLQFIAIFCAVSFVNAQNLIVNGDMSTWTEGNEKPDGYSYSSLDATPSAYFAKASEMYNGTMNVLQLTFKNSSTGSSRAIMTPSTISELAPGNYKLTFYVKGSGYLRSVNLAHADAIYTSKVKTADAATGGDSVLVARPMGTTTAAQLISEWTKYEVDYAVAIAGYYVVCFSNNNRNGDDANPFLMANISLETTTPSSDATLKALTLGEILYTGEASGDVESVPLFSPDKQNYTVELSFNYAGGVPVVAGTTNHAYATTIVTQAVNIDGTEAERTASVEVTAQTGDKQTYTVTFVKSQDFISGCHYDAVNLDNKGGWGYMDVTGVYTKTTNPDGKYWGSATIRPTSKSVFEFYTPELANGCGVLSYYLKDAAYGDTLLTDLQIQYRVAFADEWTILETIPASTLTDSYVEKTVVVNNSSATGQIRFFVDRTAEGLAELRNFLIDDVRITAYAPTGTHDIFGNSDDIHIDIQDHNIVMQCEGKSTYQVFSSTGQMILSGEFDEYKSLKIDVSGLFIVKAGNSIKKALIR
jgi:enamine deaminase RidA (YjgF/YER057c/UK114 family)